MPMNVYRRFFRRFIDGETSGSHRKVQIVNEPDHTKLVGYNHSVYAERMKDDGTVILYEGRADSDRSTNASTLHVGTLRQELDNMPMFHQVAKQDRRDELKKVDSTRYAEFNVAWS